MVKEADAIYFSPEEERWIQNYATLKGRSFSEVVHDAILEKIEDDLDVKACELALAEDDGPTCTMDEIMALCTTPSPRRRGGRRDPSCRCR